MERINVGIFLSTLAIVVPSALGARAQAPGGTNSVTVSATPHTVAFGSPTTIAGSVSGKKASGATVTLEAEPFGSTSFTKVATGTVSSSGTYSFRYTPSLNTTLDVIAKTAPPATSPTALVRVRVNVTLAVSTRHPRAGAKVRFSGFVTPGYNGRRVLIQRRTARGWKTVAHAMLVAAKPGSTGPRSRYAKRLKIIRSATYRARFIPPPGRLANNSRARRLTVHT